MAKFSLLGFALVHLIVCVPIIFCAPGKTQSKGWYSISVDDISDGGRGVIFFILP